METTENVRLFTGWSKGKQPNGPARGWRGANAAAEVVC